MRVIQVGPDSSRAGGMRTVMLTLKNSSLRQQFGMDIIPTSSKTNRFKTFVHGFRQLKNSVKSGACDCVHIHMSENASVYRTAAIVHWVKTYSRSRVIIESHGSSIQEFFDRCPRHVKQYLLHRLDAADLFVVLTTGWKMWWESLLPNMAYEVVPNSVAVPALTDFDPLDSMLASDNKVLFMGELGERKGTYLLISAIPEILAKHGDAQFVFAGDGEVEQCAAFAERLGVARHCEFVGWADPEKKAELLRESDVLVLPSKNESFGIVLLEAMSYAVPVVCSDGGFMHEVVDDGTDGIVFPSGDKNRLASAIMQLLDDPQMAKRMGNAGRIKVEEKYSTPHVIDLWREVYCEVNK